MNYPSPLARWHGTLRGDIGPKSNGVGEAHLLDSLLSVIWASRKPSLRPDTPGSRNVQDACSL